jgi:hypothetical protein
VDAPDARADRDGDRDGDGVADADERRDRDGVLGDDTDEDAPAHRGDAPVDAVPGESDLAGPGDPLPGDGLGPDTPRAGEVTVVAVDDVARQDPGVVVVPPVTDDTGQAPPPGDPDATPGPSAEAAPVPVPVETPATGPDTTPDPGTAADTSAEDRWRELQITFVDDPAAAVRDAAELLEQAIADLRQRFEGSDSTEDLRTAFRKYRDVYRGLH